MTVLFAPTDITFDEVASRLPEHAAPVFRWAGPNYGTSIAGVRSRLMGEP